MYSYTGCLWTPKKYMQRPVMWTGRNMGGRGLPKTIDIVSYASKMSVNGVTCAFVVHFRSSDTFKVCQLA